MRVLSDRRIDGASARIAAIIARQGHPYRAATPSRFTRAEPRPS
ncbi:hypothetical protein GLE_5047 [Lysobacter enzymogenes]|uniref:Uncharacterized protein n=1 Tax=Lysobacter enzymogenes TaxID=69 RepID=A0A0S2DP96_LYSEN|nr:hypothetical protein GLE_5047 [Lysobacter enzymogenes]